MIHGIYQMTPRQFRKAIDAGVFGEKKIELLGGIPFIMSQNPPHILALSRFFAPLCRLWPSPSVVCQQGEHSLAARQMAADSGMSVILRGPEIDLTVHDWPAATTSQCLVEVSDTTYAKDSEPKLRRYASFRIPVYWIVNLNRRILEVRTGPFGKGKQAGLRSATPIARGTLSRCSWTARRSDGSRYPTCCRESGEAGSIKPGNGLRRVARGGPTAILLGPSPLAPKALQLRCPRLSPTRIRGELNRLNFVNLELILPRFATDFESTFKHELINNYN